MAVSSIHNGFRFDAANTRLDVYYRGTRAGHFNATGVSITGTKTVTGLLTASAATTVTTGNTTTTAGDNRITAGNLRLGVVSTFGTTEPTSALVMKDGTAPVGAIATSGGLFSTDTVVFKIIADGSADAVGAA